MPRLPSRSVIIDCLNDQRRALHVREIAASCGVPAGSYTELLHFMFELSAEGTVERHPGNRFSRADAAKRGGDKLEGRLTVSPRGFGFVNVPNEQRDIYVAPEAMLGALHGDRVRVDVLARGARGPEGRVVEVVERGLKRVAGTLRRRRKSAWLEPDDSRVRGPIVLTGPVELARDGFSGVVALTRYPTRPDENLEGELVAVLGSPGDPNAEVAKILIREQIEEVHPAEAMAEAEAMAARLVRLRPDGRRDLRDIPLLTIDPEDARDHDDAVYVERRPDGFRAYIAIADVAEYVQPETALDEEAQARGFTIYLPDRAVPMLPGVLAADLCSLLPDHDRYAMVAIVDLDKSGKLKRYQLVEAIVRCAALVTYGTVAQVLGFSKQQGRSSQGEAFKRDLKVLDDLTRKLRRSRIGRGALDLDLPEARIELDETTGAPVGVSRRAQDPGVKRAYEMIEELMILANEIVARWLTRRKSPAVFRVHGKPDEEKLERLAALTEELDVRFDADEVSEPGGLSKWLRSIADHPRRAVLETLMLRSLKQAVYDIENIGHFGLASPAYAHFTSPIRRYPDLLVHRLIKHLLRGGEPDSSPAARESLKARASAASLRERSVMLIEREVGDVYRVIFMMDKVDETFTGRVSAVVGSGLYVSLDDPFVDVMVRFESLGPERYELDDSELGVVGAHSGDRVRLGDPITVVIEDVALLRRTVYAKRVVPDGVLSALARGDSSKGGRSKPESGARGRGRAAGERAVGERGTARNTGAARKDERGAARQGGRGGGRSAGPSAVKGGANASGGRNGAPKGRRRKK